MPIHRDKDRLVGIRSLTTLYQSAIGPPPFGRKFGAETECRLLGPLHDPAKADDRFQHYLRACFHGESAPRCPHAAAGAVVAKPYLGAFVLSILGHHAGIPDKDEARRRLADADPKSVAAAQAWIEKLKPLPGIPRTNRPS